MLGFRGFVNGLDKVIEVFLIMILSVMCVALILQVFFRYVVNSPLIWSEELSRYLFVWLTFLGAGYGVKNKLHVEMGIFFSKFPLTVKKIVQTLVNLAVIASYLFIIPDSIKFMKIQHPIMATTLDVPLSVLFAAAPIGCSLLVLFLLVDIVDVFTNKERFSGVF